MDNEILDEIVKLRIQSKILRGLVDVILDNTYLSYDGDTLRLTNEERVLTVVKTFYGEECSTRLKELQAEKQAEIERFKSKGVDTEEDRG